MHKYLISFLIVSVFFANTLQAKEERNLRIMAEKIFVKNDIITASGNVLVFSPTYYITAKKAVFNKDKNTLELFENVHISKKHEAISISNYNFLDMNNEINEASPILLIDSKSKIWVNAKKVLKKGNVHNIENATISSCETQNPAWSISFGKGTYDTEDEWISTFWNTLYIKDIPAWYFVVPFIPQVSIPALITAAAITKAPYIGFPTSNKRRTGLLKPVISYSSSEGYTYMQPIYFALADNYDFEYIPQYRTKRGHGHDLIYRYKDSRYSTLFIRAGKFYERDSYVDEENLVNKVHYGWNLDYDRSKLFSKGDDTDGLHVSLKDMNDLEYENTNSYNDTTVTDKLLKSEIKYYYNTNNYYYDIELNKYTNVSKDNDDDIMQVLPKVQIHKYAQNLFINKLTYSVDIKADRKTRTTGLEGDTTNIVVPLSYNIDLFRDYLSLNIANTINFANVRYGNINKYDDASLLQNTLVFSASTDLIKKYSSFIHSLNFTTSYTKPYILNSKGDTYGINGAYKDDIDLKTFPITTDVENVNLSLNQSFYSNETLKNIVNHKMKQSISYSEDGEQKFSNIENEVAFNYQYGSFINRLEYSHDTRKLESSSFAFKFKKDNFFTDIDYSHSQDINDNKIESIVAQLGTKIGKNYTVKYKEQYDLTEQISKIREYSLDIDKKCWKINFVLADNLVASSNLTQDAIRQKIIYATITLKPVVTFKQEYAQEAK